MPLKGEFGNFVIAPSDGCPATANLLSLDATLEIPTRVLHFEVSVRHTHARKTIIIIRPSQTPTSTSCHVKAAEPCAYFYI
jgi:hypothetical protein